jgi:hypothetical protein
MPITYLPSELIKRMASKRLVSRLVTKDLTLNRAVLSQLARSGFSKEEIESTALKVIKEYKDRFKDELSDGATKGEALDLALNDSKQMIQRVQNVIVFEVAKDIRRTYRGVFYEWLPSSANEPDPLHQLNYGKKFKIGVGEMPGERYGCQCGMRILVDEEELNIED